MSADLVAIYRAPKRFLSPPRWVASDSKWFTLTAALVIDGLVAEGLEIRGGASQTLPDRAVRFHMHMQPAGAASLALSRAEWRPMAPHTNPKCGHPHLEFMRIEGSHLHCFELNWLHDLGRMRSGNLRVARPINPEPSSYNDFLEVVGQEFRISEIASVPVPDWKMADMFGV